MKRRLLTAALAGVFLLAGLMTAVWQQRKSAAAADIIPLRLRNLDGEAVTLKTLRGGRDYILVNFWATWCAPCVHEMPLLQQAGEETPAAMVVGITYEDADAVAAFLRQNGVKYDILLTSDDIFSFFAETGNNSGGLPYTVLYDTAGNILQNKIGDFKTAAEIKNFIRRGNSL